MKILKKTVPVVLAALTVFSLSGCTENEKKDIKHEKNPIVTMQVAYTTENNEEKNGTIKMELYPDKAPDTVNNFVNLINNGFYDGLTFHRIVSDFVIQGGDPNGDCYCDDCAESLFRYEATRD